jgi:hypothetical protein
MRGWGDMVLKRDCGFRIAECGFIKRKDQRVTKGNWKFQISNCRLNKNMDQYLDSAYVLMYARY